MLWSFEVLQTSKQLTAKAVSLEPLRGISRGAAPYLYTQNMYKYALLRKHYSGYRRKKIKDEKNELFQHQMYHKNLSENLR